MKLSQLLQGVSTIGPGADSTADVPSVCYAADRCESGSLFVAIAGLAHDGHDFIPQAIERGARFIVHQKDIIVPEGVAAFRVSDSRRALGAIAKNFFGDPSSELTLIGVTGTSGKTTVSYLLESILSAAGFRSGVLGTVNYRYGGKVLPAPNTTPESYEMQKILREMANAGVTHVVAEVSSHALDLKRVDDCDFDLGIFTNLSPEHLDYHKDMEDYFRAKKRLFDELLLQSPKNRPKKAVINADDFWGRRLLAESKIGAVSYGLEKNSDVNAQNAEITLSGIRATGEPGGEKIIRDLPVDRPVQFVQHPGRLRRGRGPGDRSAGNRGRYSKFILDSRPPGKSGILLRNSCFCRLCPQTRCVKSGARDSGSVKEKKDIDCFRLWG